jgi:hypothetical protein
VRATSSPRVEAAAAGVRLPATLALAREEARAVCSVETAAAVGASREVLPKEAWEARLVVRSVTAAEVTAGEIADCAAGSSAVAMEPKGSAEEGEPRGASEGMDAQATPTAPLESTTWRESSTGSSVEPAEGR